MSTTEPLLGRARQAAANAVSNLSDRLQGAAASVGSIAGTADSTGLTSVPGVVLRREAKGQNFHIFWPHEYSVRDLPADAVPKVPEGDHEEKKKCCGKDCSSVGSCFHHPEQIDDADVCRMPVRFAVEEHSKAIDAAACGPWRKADFAIKSAKTDATLFTVERPQRCGPLYPAMTNMNCFCGMYPCCGCLCNQQEMDVHDADGNLVGSVVEVFTPGCTCYCCKRSEIEIRDADDKLLFLLRSDPLGVCYEPLGVKVPTAFNQAYGFEILQPFEGEEVPPAASAAKKKAQEDALGDALVDPAGQKESGKKGRGKAKAERARRTVSEFEETGCAILNMWAGAGSWRSMPWTASNSVKVQFPERSTEQHRALLLAAGLFLEYTYFARVPQYPVFQGLMYVAMCRCGCTDHLDPDPEKPGTRYYS